MARLSVQQIDQHIQDSDAGHDWDDSFIEPNDEQCMEEIYHEDLSWLFDEPTDYGETDYRWLDDDIGPDYWY